MGLPRSLPILVLSVALTGGFAARADDEVDYCRESRITPMPAMQDQDGLATCYANVAALLLQNRLSNQRIRRQEETYQRELAAWEAEESQRLREQPADVPVTTQPRPRPEHPRPPAAAPPISYQHLSLIQLLDKRQSTAATDEFGLTRQVGPTTRVLETERGMVCAPLESASRHGYCTAQSFGHDATEDTVNVQRYVLLELGRFLDEQSGNDLILNLARDVDYARSVRDRLAFQLASRNVLCRPQPGERPVDTKARFIARRMLTRLAHGLASGNPYYAGLSPEQRQQVRERLFTNGNPTQGPSSQAYKSFMQILLGLPGQTCAVERAKRLDPEARCGGPISWAEGYRARDYNETSDDSRIPRENVESDEALVWRLMRDMGLDLPAPPEFPTHNTHIAADLAAWNICYRTHFGVDRATLEEALAPLCHSSDVTTVATGQQYQLADQVVAALQALQRLDATTRVQAFMDIAAPNCRASAAANRPNVGDIRCDQVRMPSQDLALDGVTDRILGALCSNRAVGVEICTDFMTNGASARVNTHFCTSRGAGVPGHGLHAVAVVGHRSVSVADPRTGAMRRQDQFLVQNSWGAHCPGAQGIQCEVRRCTESHPVKCHAPVCDPMNPESCEPPVCTQAVASVCETVVCPLGERCAGTPTGRWWVGQSLLIQNSIATTVIP